MSVLIGTLYGSTGGATATGTLTIDHTKCGTTNSMDFPVLVLFTNNKLKTIANGGNVANASGFDIVFTSDLAGTTLLSWEVESWNGNTGSIIAWVKVATVSHTVDTVFYMNVGNPIYTTFQGGATGAAWNSNFSAVYHFPDGTTLTSLDSTANANNGTLVNAPTAGTGIIDGAANFDGATQRINVAGGGWANTLLTVECWVNYPANQISTCFVTSFLTIVGWAFGISDSNTNAVKMFVGKTGTNVTAESTGTVIPGVWTYVSTTYDGATVQIYINAVADGSAAFTGPIGYAGNNQAVAVLEVSAGGTVPVEFYPGLIDELRISNINRPLSWLTTCLNNQNSPGTFLTVVL